RGGLFPRCPRSQAGFAAGQGGEDTSSEEHLLLPEAAVRDGISPARPEPGAIVRNPEARQEDANIRIPLQQPRPRIRDPAEKHRIAPDEEYQLPGQFDQEATPSCNTHELEQGL